MRSKREVDGVIAALADRQHGVVARRQLLAHGVSGRMVDLRIAAGHLIVVYRAVYALGHRNLTARGHQMAAALALGPRAAISHKSAGSMWGLLRTGQTRMDLTVPGAHARGRAGLRVHVTDRFDKEDVTTLDEVPVTSVARTILDLASVLNKTQLLRVIEQAERSGQLNLLAVQHAMARRTRAPGIGQLKDLLAAYTVAPPTKSELENLFLDFVRRTRLPRPQINVNVGGYLVDAYWPQFELVVELDSRGFHSNPRVFETDRIRDARLQRLGLRIIRVTYNRLIHEPASVLDDILALARLSSGGRGLDRRLARN